MIESATEFRKSGYSDEDSAILAEIAAKFQNVADSQISAGEASSFIISQMIAFGIAAEDAESIIDKVNEVSNRFAVSSTDLSKGLNIVASTSSSMGNSIDETLAILTAITEETRNANKAARGMNTIFANLAQVLDESSSNGEKISEIFDKLNVSMYNSDGQLKSSYDLIEGLSSKWSSLDTNYQNYIASTIAGTNQLNNFLALMNNFPHATDAVGVSLNSAGSAAKENERVMESISAKITQLQASFQQLAASIVDSDLVKLLLDIANTLLQLANTDVGRFVTQVGLITGVLWGGKGLLKAMKIIPNLFGAAGTAVSKFEKILNISAPKLAAIATAIAVIINLIPKVIDWFHKMNPSLEDLEEEAGTLEQQLSANKDRLKEIEQIPWKDRTSDIIRETEELKKENEELQKKLDLTNEEIKVRQASDIRQKYSIEYTGYTVDIPNAFSQNYTNLESLINGLKEAGYLAEDFAGSIDDVKDALVPFQGYISESGSYIQTFEESLRLMGERYQELWTKVENNTATADEREEFRQLAEQMRNVAGEIDNTDGMLEQFSESEQDQLDVIRKLNGGYLDALNLLNRYNESIDAADYALSLLVRKQEIDTTQKELLLNKYPQLINYIEQTETGYKLSNNALAILTNSQLTWAQTAIAASKAAMQAQIEDAKAVYRVQLATAKGTYGIAGQEDQYIKLRDAAAATLKEIEDLQFSLKMLERGYKLPTPIIPDDDGDECPHTTNLKNTKEQLSEEEKLNQKIKERKELFDKEYKNLEHELFLLQQQDATVSEQNDKRSEMQESLHRQAELYRSMGLTEESEYIQELQKLWWELEKDKKEALKKWVEERIKIEKEAAEKSKKIQQDLINYIKEKTTENINAEIEALEKVKDEWQLKAEAYEAYASLMEEYIDTEIEAIQKELDALDKSNEELEDKIALEEKLDALARARSQKVMVYKDGQWQYAEDIDAVSKAESDLEEYQRQQSLKDQKKALEDQIAILEEYKKQWSDLSKDYEYWEKKRLIAEALGIDIEKENFSKMLGNAQSFAKDYTIAMQKVANAVDLIEAANKRLEAELLKYEQMMKALEGGSSSTTAGNKVGNALSNVVGGVVGGSVGSAIDQAGNMIGTGINTALDILKNASSSSSSSSGVDWSAKWWEAENNPNLSASEKKALQDAYHAEKEKEMAGTGKKYNSATGKWYAQGTLNAQAGISLVGEKGPELRVFNQGDGILPSDITQNLWQWGTLSPSQLFSSFKDKASQWINLTIQNLNLPQVKDGPDFVNYLTNNFMRTVIQNNV